MSATELDGLASYRWSRRTIFVNYLNTAVYPPPFYIPSAVVWRVGEQLNFTIIHTLYLVRACNAFCAIALGWLALRLASTVRLLLLAFLLLPALMAIESSCSQDALLIPVCALMMSLIARALASHRLFQGWELVILAAGLACCVAARPPYVTMILILALPGIEMRASRLRHWIGPVFSALFVVALVAFWRVLIRSAELSHSGVAQPALQMAYIKAHFARVAGVLSVNALVDIPSLIEKGTQFIELKGLPAMMLFHGLHILSFLCILLLAKKVKLQLLQSRLLLSTALLLIVAGTSLAEYIIWNAPGSNRVLGVQARYYLPLFPFATFLAFRSATSSIHSASTWLQARLQRFLPAAVAVYLAWICYTPWLLAQRYDNDGLLASLQRSLY